MDLTKESKELTDLQRLNVLFALGKNFAYDASKPLKADDSDVIANELFGYRDVVGFEMVVENGFNVGAKVYYKTCKLVGHIGKARKPMFRHYVKYSTVYFAEYKVAQKNAPLERAVFIFV